MTRQFIVAAIVSACLALSAPIEAQRGGGSRGSSPASGGTKGSASSKPVHVRAYTKKDGTRVRAYDRRAPNKEGATLTTTTADTAPDDEYVGLLGLTQTQIQLHFGSPSLTSDDTWSYDGPSGRFQMSFTDGVVSATILPDDFEMPIIPRIETPAPSVSLPPASVTVTAVSLRGW
jgi:hypothetical protein